MVGLAFLAKHFYKAAMPLPILYSFRRCPYAMRARLALAYSQIPVQLREVVLRDKPPALLAASSKGTVPVLVLPNGEVLDESLDIMLWALAQNDPHQWAHADELDTQACAMRLVRVCDTVFKPKLDRYKYPNRYSDSNAEEALLGCEKLIAQWNTLLQRQPFLMGKSPCLADAAIMPFVRQFAHVDKAWFDATPYDALKRWLNQWLASPLFISVMAKYPQWQAEDAIIHFPSAASDISDQPFSQ